MGRGDGSGRIVSADDADDTGTGILHVDMDAFYAAVEVLDDPSLRGQAAHHRGARGSVGGLERLLRGAPVRRALGDAGVAGAAALPVARSSCRPHFDRYQALSRQVMAIFQIVHAARRAAVDRRGLPRRARRPAALGEPRRDRPDSSVDASHDETGLTCSVGVAATKHVAKMASTISKPDGMLVVAGRRHARLSSRPRSGAGDVGRRAEGRRGARGARHPDDRATSVDTPRDMLDRIVGAGARVSASRSSPAAIDPREVDDRHASRRASATKRRSTRTSATAAFLRSELLRLADRVARAPAQGRMGRRDRGDQGALRRLHDDQPVADALRANGCRPADRRRGSDALRRRSRPASRSVCSGCAPRSCAPAGGGGIGLWDDDEDWRKVEGALDDGGRAVRRRRRHAGPLHGPAERPRRCRRIRARPRHVIDRAASLSSPAGSRASVGGCPTLHWNSESSRVTSA